MKFLLVALNAKFIHSNPALFSLAAFSSKYREHIEIVEYTINNLLEEILGDIYKRKPDYIGFSCYIWNYTQIEELIEEVHKVLPQVKIWLGGPEVSFDAQKIAQRKESIEGIIVGEGEKTLQQLISYYLGTLDKPFESIPGIVTKFQNNENRELLSMDEIPFLYEDLSKFTNRIIYYETSRGCPFRCSYCLSSIDKMVRFRSFSLVKEELQFFLDRKVSQVKFIDRTFNCDHEHAMQIWKYIVANDNQVTNFHFEIAATILNEEEIDILHAMRPGLAQLEIGVQSTNPATIHAINRVMDVKKLASIVGQIKEGKNIHIHLDLIAGLPYEDYETFQRSFNEVYKMRPEQLQLGFLKVLKGTLMQENKKEYGLVYMDNPPYEVLFTKWIAYEEIIKLKKIEKMVELFYNSNQFTTVLPLLEKAFSTPFSMFYTMAEYFEEMEYFIKSPARSYRYGILLDFAIEVDKKNIAIYKELLVHDMYLRENLKSRPAFAKEGLIEGEKDSIRQFYINEEIERESLPSYQEYNYKQLAKMTHVEIYETVGMSNHFEKITNRKDQTTKDQITKDQITKDQITKDQITKEKIKNDKIREDKIFVLYDYQKRDPLTGEARTILLKKEDKNGNIQLRELHEL